MTSFCYNADDIYKWAEFSGDFNPIHFDNARAANLNLPNVLVHGMRVMLDIKSAMFHRAVQPNGTTWIDTTDWLLYKATLRSPVLLGKSYILNIDEKRTGYHYTLTDEQSLDECITGYIRLIPSPNSAPNTHEDLESAWRLFTIIPEELTASISAFLACSQSHRDPWLLLDALLFRIAMKEESLFTHMSQSLQAFSIRSTEELMQKSTVLQTHHSTLISNKVQKLRVRADGRVGDLDKIDCIIESPITDGNPMDGFVVQTTLAAYDEEGLLLRTTVGLKIFVE